MSRPAPRPDRFEAEFWEAAAGGRPHLQRCVACGRWRYPPGPLCPDCGSDGYRWEETSGRGTLIAWTIFHRTYFPQLPAPYRLVSVETREGPLVVGGLLGPATKRPIIGAAVEAAMEPLGDDTGFICQWRLAEDNHHLKGEPE